MKRPLPPRQRVRMLRIYLKKRPAILQMKSVPFHHHARPEGILHHRFLVWISELPRVAIEKIFWIELILLPDRDLLRGLDAHHRWNNGTDQRPSFPVEIFQPGDVFWVHARVRG